MKRGIFERADTWIGKTLFVPLIVRACQHIKVSQFRFGRTCWFAACLIGLYFGTGWISKLIFGVGAFICCLTASLVPDNVRPPSQRWLRLFLVVCMVLSVPRWMFGHETWNLPYGLLALFAEYAFTIRTIPPLESKETAPSRLHQEAA